jgi:hypothetical protein
LKTQHDTYLSIDTSEGVYGVLRRIFEWVQNKSDNAHKEIVKGLLLIQKQQKRNRQQGNQCENGDDNNDEQLGLWDDFPQEIVSEINNAALRFSGKECQARFTPRTLRVSLALYLRAKTGYEELQKGGAQVYPSAR